MTILPSIYTFGWDFKKQDIQNGMIFYEIGSAAISKTTWRLTYYYNLTDYFDNIQKLVDSVDTIDELCHKGVKIIECTALLALLKEHLRNTQLNAQKIESFDKRNRQKRWAPLGLFGDAFGWLFGLATDSDAETINNRINKMESHILAEKEQMESQLYIVEQSVKIHNETYNQLRNKIEEFANIVKHDQIKNNLHTKINSLSNIANMIISMNTETYKDILNLLQDSLNGKIINLISQGTLTSNLRKISSNLEINQKLPINLDAQSPYNIFSVTNVQGILSNRRILITLYIPVIDADDLRLYKSVPIPIKMGEMIFKITPKAEFFLFNSNRRELTPMENSDLNNCRRSFNNVLICRPEQPTFVRPEASCEMSLLLKPEPSVVNTICEIKSIPKRNYITSLYQNNSYYCVITNPITVSFSCPGKTVSQKTFTENGIITLQSGCSMITNEMKFTAQNNIVDEEDHILSPMFNISEVSSESILNISRNWNEIPLQNFSMIPLEDKNEEFANLLNIIENERQKNKAKEEYYELLVQFHSKPKDPLHIIIGYYSFGLISFVVFYMKVIHPWSRICISKKQ